MKDLSFLLVHQRPIVYYPIYTDLTGSLPAGILMSQLLYWFSAVNGRPFYKGDKELLAETRLTPSTLKAAKSTLKTFSWISITRKGVPARTWYDFDITKLQSSLAKFANLDGVKPPISSGENEPTITESTAESTTDISFTVVKELKPTTKKINLVYALYHEWARRYEALSGIDLPRTTGGFFKVTPKYATALSSIQKRLENYSGAGDMLTVWETFLESILDSQNRFYLENFTPDMINCKWDAIVLMLTNMNKSKTDRTWTLPEVQTIANQLKVEGY